MSHAILIVRFPDGALRYGDYSGTSDLPNFDLYVKREDWRKARSHDERHRYESHCDEVFPVEIYSGYGGGWVWKGTATKHCLVDTGYTFDDDGDRITPEPILEGRPPWASAAEEGV